MINKKIISENSNENPLNCNMKFEYKDIDNIIKYTLKFEYYDIDILRINLLFLQL